MSLKQVSMCALRSQVQKHGRKVNYGPIWGGAGRVVYEYIKQNQGNFHVAQFQNGGPQASRSQDEQRTASAGYISSNFLQHCRFLDGDILLLSLQFSCHDVGTEEWFLETYFLTGFPVTHNTHFQGWSAIYSHDKK